MSVARPGIRASTRHARAVYPFQAETGLGWRGCLIGSDSSGGAFCFDPWELYRSELVANPNVAVFGELGYGKSALMKSLLWRMLLFGRRAFVLDVKGEYAPLCEALGVQPVRLAPGNGVRLNPLSARRERAAQVEILRAVARTAVGRELGGERLNHPYLLFESNFNGAWEQYIDAFSEVVAFRMKAIWGTSFGFPGPLPVEPFKAYIRHNEFVANHYFSAYPGATTSEIVSAARVEAALEEFRSSAGLDAEAFGVAYDAFLTRVQGDL